MLNFNFSKLKRPRFRGISHLHSMSPETAKAHNACRQRTFLEVILIWVCLTHLESLKQHKTTITVAREHTYQLQVDRYTGRFVTHLPISVSAILISALADICPKCTVSF